jgi:hypothetical protein
VYRGMGDDTCGGVAEEVIVVDESFEDVSVRLVVSGAVCIIE